MSSMPIPALNGGELGFRGCAVFLWEWSVWVDDASDFLSGIHNIKEEASKPKKVRRG